jgi:hypothetical protein
MHVTERLLVVFQVGAAYRDSHHLRREPWANCVLTASTPHILGENSPHLTRSQPTTLSYVQLNPIPYLMKIAMQARTQPRWSTSASNLIKRPQACKSLTAGTYTMPGINPLEHEMDNGEDDTLVSLYGTRSISGPIAIVKNDHIRAAYLFRSRV